MVMMIFPLIYSVLNEAYHVVDIILKIKSQMKHQKKETLAGIPGVSRNNIMMTVDTDLIVTEIFR